MQDPFWNKHYAQFTEHAPSRFAEVCKARYVQPTDTLIELGCGNGRDGIFLGSAAERYIGLDACNVAVSSFRDNIKATKGEGSSLEVRQGDFTDLDFNTLSQDAKRLFIYSRFSFHSVTYPEADRLLTNLAKINVAPWFMAMEVRTVFDDLYGEGNSVGLHEFKTDHYRRFIDPDVLLGQLASMFSVQYFELGRGFAPYQDQDPVILRVGLQAKPR